jgi:hypothetical protein
MVSEMPIAVAAGVDPDAADADCGRRIPMPPMPFAVAVRASVIDSATRRPHPAALRLTSPVNGGGD